MAQSAWAGGGRWRLTMRLTQAKLMLRHPPACELFNCENFVVVSDHHLFEARFRPLLGSFESFMLGIASRIQIDIAEPGRDLKGHL